jgi:hypothetical protein
MDVRAPETHKEALLAGDGYALVWPDRDDHAVIWPIPACDMAVSYDPNQPGVIRRAARVWWDEDDGRTHVDVFLPDRVERYVSKAPRRSPMALGNPNHFQPYQPVNIGGLETPEVEDNRWGRVPVFHFPNKRHHGYGISELSNVVPLQRALNKTLVDLMVAQEFSAFRQRWATGLDLTEGPADADGAGGKVSPPFDYGNDRMIAATDPETKFGTFESSDLTQYVEVLENFRSEIARVSGTPLHYLFITRGDFPSGEAMKSAEARFSRKVENRQGSFGNQWEDLLALALRMEGAGDVIGAMLSLEWDPADPSAAEAAAAAAAEADGAGGMGEVVSAQVAPLAAAVERMQADTTSLLDLMARTPNEAPSVDVKLEIQDGAFQTTIADGAVQSNINEGAIQVTAPPITVDVPATIVNVPPPAKPGRKTATLSDGRTITIEED